MALILENAVQFATNSGDQMPRTVSRESELSEEIYSLLFIRYDRMQSRFSWYGAWGGAGVCSQRQPQA